jgi:long-chain acyl-CoA synthetase
MSQKKPWLKFYEPHVPEHLDYPSITLPAALEETASKHPDFPAYIFKGTVITYQSHFQYIERFSAALQYLGIKKGDRVAIHLPNCPQFPISFFAILRSGGVVVPCNPTYTPREMRHQLNDSAPFIRLFNRSVQKHGFDT